MNEKRDIARSIKTEVMKVIKGKDTVVDKVLTAILAEGHILLEDIPGVGKTTLALAFSKAMGLKFNRVQFTPDVVPSDITGFTMYNKVTGKFEYCSGAAMCNFFLADEINRTSSKTQSALLEVMQESSITVDGETHEMPQPFIVMATQNPVGTAGTQMLPDAQLDRFMVKLSMGYPDIKSQIEILKERSEEDPLEKIDKVATPEDVIAMCREVRKVFVDDKIYSYIARLAEATRNNEYVKLGVSPRGAIALCRMAKAAAYINNRDFVTPEDVIGIFADVCMHRLILFPKARLAGLDESKILDSVIAESTAPKMD